MSEPRQAAQRREDGRRPGRRRRTFTIRLDPALCKSCGICVKLCPREVFEAAAGSAPPTVARPADCNGCRFCELHCPEAAIEVLAEDAEETDPVKAATAPSVAPSEDDEGDD